MKKAFLSLLALAFFACNYNEAELLDEHGAAGSITRFTVHDGYMYALNPNEIQTYSLENPDQPKLVSTLTTDYGLETITIYDGIIYVGSRDALYILDIVNPAVPKLLSKSERAIGNEVFRGCDPVVVKGDYAYSTVKIIERVCGRVSAESGLVVWNIADKSNPVQEAFFPLNAPNGLGYKGNYLFVCDEGSDRLEIFDITKPAQVTTTAYAVSITDPIDLIVNGDKMIVSTRTDFYVLDISNIGAIKTLAVIHR